MSIAQVSGSYSDPVQLVGAALHAAFQGTLLDVVAEGLPESLKSRQGAFVTLLKHGALRGCMGTFWPLHRHAGREVVWSSLQAALNDVRFPPLVESELGDIDVIVDLLQDPVRTSLDKLDGESAVLVELAGFQVVILPSTSSVGLDYALELRGPGSTVLSALGDVPANIDTSAGSKGTVERLLEAFGSSESSALWSARCQRFFGPLPPKPTGATDGI